MNIYLSIILLALLTEFILNSVSRYLDLKNLSVKLPVEFKNYYSQDEYERSQEYFRENAHFLYLTSTLYLFVTITIIFSGFFNVIDLWLRSYEFSPIITGLLFFALLILIQDALNTPFSIYQTF